MSVTDEMLCFSLYSATRATTQTYRTLLAPWNLTYPQYLVLAVLWNDGDQTIRSSARRCSSTLAPSPPCASSRADRPCPEGPQH